jgi:hypothetical protein
MTFMSDADYVRIRWTADSSAAFPAAVNCADRVTMHQLDEDAYHHPGAWLIDDRRKRGAGSPTLILRVPRSTLLTGSSATSIHSVSTIRSTPKERGGPADRSSLGSPDERGLLLTAELARVGFDCGSLVTAPHAAA